MKSVFFKGQRTLWLVVCSGLACGLAFVAISWKPISASVPGAAGGGVVHPAFGSYGASIDIDVPGYYDLEPEVKLTYSSSNSNGIAGMGWNVSGESYIERCSPNGGAPKYNSTDAFYLDGGKLLANTTFGGTHVTETVSFERIKQDVANNKWEIWDTDGTKSTYLPLYVLPQGTFRWALATKQDTNGNTVIYNYWQDTTGKNWYLDNITYNGYTIKFWREVRPDPVSFSNGINIGYSTYRLKTIQVKVGTSTRVAYKLSYIISADSKNSLLTSVQEYGRDAIIDAAGTITGGTSLPAETMAYYNNPTTTAFPSVISDTRIGGAAIWNSSIQNHIMDINGDHKADLVRIKPDPTNSTKAVAQLNLSTGAGTPFSVLTSNTAIGGWSTTTRENFADISGDGRPDLIRIYKYNGQAIARVYLCTGTGFAPVAGGDLAIGPWSDVAQDHFLDMNDDGKADFVRFRPNPADTGLCQVQVKLSNGIAFPADTTLMGIGVWHAGNYKDNMADVNGDGLSDVVRIFSSPTTPSVAKAWIWLSNGAGGFNAESWNKEIGNPWNPANTNFRFMDVNGDGKEDLIRLHQNNTVDARCEVNFSNGAGYPGIVSDTLIGGGWNSSVNKYFYSDINGDGLTDIVTLRPDPNLSTSARAYVNICDGNGFVSSWWVGNVAGWSSNYVYNFSDVNGDAKSDFSNIHEHSPGQAWAEIRLAGAAFNAGSDQLVSMTNGAGGTTSIAYTTASIWPSVHTNRGGNFLTVDTVAVSDGRGNSGVTTYSYADAKYSTADRAFLGFRLQEAVVNDQGTYIEIFNRQTIQSIGQSDAIYTRNNAGLIYSYTTYTYTESGDGITVPYKSLVSETNEFENNLTANSRQIRSTFQYDLYGNQTLAVSHGDVGVTGDEFTKEVEYNINTAGTGYIVDAVKAERLYSGTSVVAANKKDETLCYYDGATSTATPPTKGNLTRADRWKNTDGTYATTSSAFDSYGNQIASTDLRGFTTTTVFDAVYHQYPISMTNALNHTTTITWDYVLGLQDTITDPNGATVNYDFDVLGRFIRETDAAGNVTTAAYLNTGDPNNQRVRKTAPDGSADGLWIDTYTDGLGRPYKAVKEGPSAGVTYVQETVYNDADQSPQKTSLWYQSGGTPKWELYEYDGVGRLTKTTHADGSFATIAYLMDASNKPYTKTIDEVGHERSVWVDTGERVTRIQEKNGVAFYNTYRTYDTLGRLIEIKDTNNVIVSTFAYNSWGQNTSSTDINLGTRSRVFDHGGLVLSATDALGQTTTFTYDQLGRVKTKTSSGSVTNWFYDEAGYGASIGRCTRVVYPGTTGSETYTYNNLGLATSVTRTIDSVSKTMSTTYDSSDRTKTMTYPDGEVVTYDYHSDGNLASVSGYVTAMTWGANGELKQVNYANNTVATYTYDPNRLWLNTAEVKFNTTTLYTASYTYRADQMVQTMTQGTPSPQTTVYTYDDLNRLLQVTGGGQDQSFTYDAVGNMTYNSLVGTYTYGDAAHKHAVTSAGAGTYTYNANGDMLTGNGRTFAWDNQGRLASVTQSGSTTTFAYGSGNDRIKKTKGANITRYFSSVLERSNSSDIQYYYAGPILVAKKDVSTGTKSWYHADRLGSVRLMTNAAGAEVKDYDYRPFGAVLNSSGTVANERGFTGQIFDAETGLMYFNARYYDATLGRFVSADSASPSEDDPQDLNGYSYCSNNPINNTDPSGNIRVFAGWQRYIVWMKKTVTKVIWIKVPYVIVYYVKHAFWIQVAVGTKMVSRGYEKRPMRVVIYKPVLSYYFSRHTKTGYYLNKKLIHYTIKVPTIHWKRVYKDISLSGIKSTIKKKATGLGKALIKTYITQYTGAWEGIKIGAKWVVEHKKAVLTVLVIVAAVALVVATGGLASPLLTLGLAGGLAARGGIAALSAAFSVSADLAEGGKSWDEIARNAGVQAAIGFASAGVGQYIYRAALAKNTAGILPGGERLVGKVPYVVKAAQAETIRNALAFSFSKDMLNNMAIGKNPGDALTSAAKNLVVNAGSATVVVKAWGGPDNPLVSTATSAVVNAANQFVLRW